MFDLRNKIRQMKESGDNLAALFLVVAVTVIVIGSVWLVPTNNDNLAKFVPRSALVYAHASGSGLQRSVPIIPPELVDAKPEEAAAFAFSSSEGISWGYLLRFKGEVKFPKISKDVQIWPLDEQGVFLVGSGQAHNRVLLAAEGGSLIGQKEIRQTLSKLSERHAVQVYVQPSGFSAFINDLPFSAVSEIVMTKDADGHIMTTPLSPGKLPKSRVNDVEMPFWADILVRGQLPQEIRAMLMNRTFGESFAIRPSDELIGYFDYVEIFAARVGEEGSDFAVKISGLDSNSFMAALRNHFAKNEPIARTAYFPDGTTYRELVLSDEWVEFVEKNGVYSLFSHSKSNQLPQLFIKPSDGYFWLYSSQDIDLSSLIIENNKSFFCFRFPQPKTNQHLIHSWLGKDTACLSETVDKGVVIY